MPRLFQDFHDHPHSVGETYGQHWWSAMGFAFRLLGCALACAVHAFVPGLCKTTASRSLSSLHQHMVTHRHRQAAAGMQGSSS
jgi:ATP:corrinoid adenosyltransferase